MGKSIIFDVLFINPMIYSSLSSQHYFKCIFSAFKVRGFPSLLLRILALPIFIFITWQSHGQTTYSNVAAYSLRKLNTGYTGNDIQVRRPCDGATLNIGFTACGDLDTVSLRKFIIGANPLTQIGSSVDAAYSLRRMYCSYNGPAIRVRSTAVGSPTMDIGFNINGDLDTIALKTFVGLNSAFVTRWYDQTTNNYHARQLTNADQPRIINTGVLDQQNGRPSLYFDGVSDFMQNDNYTMLLNGQSPTSNAVIVPAAPTNTSAPIVSWSLLNGIANQLQIGPANNWNTSWWSNLNFLSVNGSTVTNGSFQILTSLYTLVSNPLYINGTLSYLNLLQVNPYTSFLLPLGSSATPLIIGNDNCCAGRFIKGHLFEIVLSASNFSTVDREFLEWNQGDYYNVHVPPLTTMPATASGAFVTTWYDQSGTGKHAIQTVTANQPRIMTAGAIEKTGVNPAVRFTGFPQNLVAPLSTSLYPVSISVLGTTNGNSSNGAFLKLGTSVNAGQGGIAIGIGNSGGTFDNNGTSIIGLKEWVTWSPSNPNASFPNAPFTAILTQQSGNNMSIFVNGTNVPLSNSGNAPGGSLAGNLFIGGYTNVGNRYAAVKESELIVFPTEFLTTRRTLLETSQAAHYNITISNNKYTAPSATTYKRFVNGVGRESATDSISGTRNTMGLGFIVGQAATDYLKDNGDYMTAGMNCPTATGITSANLPPAVSHRWQNDWYITKTDIGSNNGVLTIYFDYSDYGVGGLPGAAANYELLFRNSASGTFSIVSGTTKTVVGDRVEFSVNASQIPTGHYYTIGTASISASPLPITLSFFSAECINGKAVISWATATEKNNDYFTIERTHDGVIYEEAGTMRGAGNSLSEKKYTFTDDRPFDGISYYRLRQTDQNKLCTYYKFEEVSCDHSQTEISIFPNPANNSFKIAGVPAQAKVCILNSYGQTIFCDAAFDTSETVDIRYYANGIYFINISGAGTSSTKKLVVQH